MYPLMRSMCPPSKTSISLLFTNYKFLSNSDRFGLDFISNHMLLGMSLSESVFFLYINFQFIQSIGRELVIESAKVADIGKYVCMVGNNIGMKMKSVDVWLTVNGTTTSTTTTTTTKPPTTTTTSTTTTAGLKIRMYVVHYI